MSEERSIKKILRSYERKKLIAIVLAGVVLLLVLFRSASVAGKNGPAEIDINAAFKDIENIDKLNTFSSTYKGVAMVPDEKYPEVIDVYVLYEATVTASLNFSEIEFEKNEENNELIIHLPEISVSAPVVSDGFEYIFNDKRRDNTGMQETAKEYCRKDVEKEYTEEERENIRGLAEENAKNVVSALCSPIIEAYMPGTEIKFA